MPRYARIHWIRWLSARDVPRADIARVLGCAPSAVSVALRRHHGRTRWDVDAEAEAAMRRLRDEGLTLREIGLSVGVPGHVVHNRLLGRTRWAPKVRDRPPGAGILNGRVGGWCRRLAGLGYPADRIAELLGLEVSTVADFLGRIRPDGRIRPKPPPGAAPPGPWLYRDQSPRQDLVGSPAPPAELPELVTPEACAAPAAGAPLPATSPGDWGADFGRRRREDPDAAEIRELRAQGMEVRELAAMFEKSEATIKRICAAAAADPPPPAAEDLDPPPEPELVPLRNNLRGPRPALDEIQVAEILEERAQGLEVEELAGMYGVASDVITRVLRGVYRPAPAPPAVDEPAIAAELAAAVPTAPRDDGGDWRYFGGAPPCPGPRRSRRTAPVTE